MVAIMKKKKKNWKTWVDIFKNMGGNIPGGSFLGRNFPEVSLIGGHFPAWNFSGGCFPDTEKNICEEL